VTSAVAEIGSSASNYEIFGKLAKGGMAEIFLARAATAAGVSRFVVLKRVLQEKASDLQFLRMFLDEARLAAQLQHPNIAQVYDVGRLGDSYFFTMEYVHGVTLRELMMAVGQQPMPMGAVLAIAAGTAAGLHHAHERIGVDGRPLGIVHRDVSPSNLMVSFEGHVKVVDFGIAKATSRTQETHSGTVRGKISYLSPEQAVGGVIDRRSDIFSLGIVMWEMLTGLRLYKRESDYASMAAVVEEAVPALPPECPPGLCLLVMRALAKRPEERFQSAQEMLDSIEHAAAAIGTPLSSAALSRYVRDIFGNRPEPWAGMAPGTTRNILTVNAEPLPQELIVPPRGEIDRQLAGVHDFTSTIPPSVEFDARPTIMLNAPEAVPTPSSGIRLPGMSMPSPTILPPALPAPPEPRRGMSPLWIGAISFGLAIGLALAARIYIKGRGATPPSAKTPVAVVQADAGVEEVVTAPPPAVVEADAGVTQPASPADAAPVPVEPAQQDAAVKPQVAPSNTPNPFRPNNPDRPANPDRPIKRPKTPDAPGQSPDWQAFAACASTGAAKGAAACVEVACRLQMAEKARTWITKVPASKRATIIALCKLDGIELEASKLPDSNAGTNQRDRSESKRDRKRRVREEDEEDE
jgi:serine/threonine-protein kinase